MVLAPMQNRRVQVTSRTQPTDEQKRNRKILMTAKAQNCDMDHRAACREKRSRR